MSNASHVDKHPCLGGCVQKTFIWSHTAFKRTCETACIVKSLSLKLDVVLFHFISQSALNRSSHQQWVCWTESRCCCLAKVFFFPFFLYILLYFFVCSVVVSSPPKTFEQLYMKCVVVALVVVFFLFDIIGCVQTSCALRVAFKNPFQVSFLRLPLGKRLTGATLFFSFSPELYKCGVQVQEGADCTHTNYDPRCLWALYPVFTFYLWAKRRWLYPSGSR